MNKRLHLTLAALAATLTWAATASASTLVNDTWRDATRTDPVAPSYSEDGFDGDSDLDLESAWYSGGTSGTTATSTAGHLLLTGAAAGSSSWTTYFTPEATPVNLSATGHKVKVTWEFTPNNVNVSNTSQNFRFALMNTPGAARISADGVPASAAYTGYAIFANMGQTLGNGNPFRLMERNVASGDTLGTSGNWVAIGTTGATSGNTGYASGTKYTLTWEMTRNASAGLDIVVKMAGGNLNNSGSATVTFTDPTPNSFAYDMFHIRPSSGATTADSYDTTLFKVELTTPEPASLGMLGLGALGLLAARRRR